MKPETLLTYYSWRKTWQPSVRKPLHLLMSARIQTLTIDPGLHVSVDESADLLTHPLCLPPWSQWRCLICEGFIFCQRDLEQT